MKKSSTELIFERMGLTVPKNIINEDVKTGLVKQKEVSQYNKNKNTKDILFERMETIGGMDKKNTLNEDIKLFLESFSSVTEDWVNDPETGLKVWKEPDVNKAERGIVNYDDETPEDQSGFCKYSPEISKWALQSADNLAMVLTFVIISQQESWGRLMAFYPDVIEYIYREGNGVSFPPYQDGATFKAVATGFKQPSIDKIWRNKMEIFNNVINILKPFNYEDKSKKSEVAALQLFQFLATRIGGLGNVKAGFATQLIIGRSGCIDSINSKLFAGEMPKGADGSYRPETIKQYYGSTFKHIKNYDDYLKSLNDESSKTLWDKWTEIVSNKLLFAPDPTTGRKAKDTYVKKGDTEVNTKRYVTQPEKYRSSKFADNRSPMDISQQHHPEYVRDEMGISADAMKLNKKR